MHTLLLADDSVTIQRVIELTFAEEDVQVVAVSDGDQAIQRLESAPPDIVLADIGMPGRNGYEVARYVRQSPRLSHIPVVLLTGAFEPVDQAKASEVGCDGVLAKPFEPQLVIGRVKELLASPGRKQPFAPVTETAAPAEPVASSASLSPVAVEPPNLDPATAAASSSLDEYFDRLDNAFANISAAAPPITQATPPIAQPTPPITQATPPVAAPPPHDLPVAPAARAVEETPAIDLPLSYASPAPPEPAVVAASKPEPVVRSLPSVADAFAAILAAEQPQDASARPVWPSPAPSPAPPREPAPVAPPVISDAVIDQIVERVLARISVGDRVGEVAERLVREEIERIKASIR